MTTSETDTSRRLEEERRLHAQRELDDGDAETIERNIDATRADMRATLEALERRFSFDRLVDLTVGRIRERGGAFAGNLTDAATENPLPLLLTSIGVGWMMLASRRGGRGNGSAHYSTSDGHGGLGERVRNARDRAAYAADRVHGAAESTRDTLRQAADSSRDALRSASDSWRNAAESSRETFEHTAESLRSGAGRAAEATREQFEHARARVDRLLDEQPLMLGALGLAAGAIIGALLPTTEHEDRFLGEARDKVIKDVAQKSRAGVEAAREKVAEYTPSSIGNSGEDSGSEQSTSRPQTSRPH
jgi:ElaB/YqjD/DUF883 family membrane-anchored ribosome-binding protein